MEVIVLEMLLLAMAPFSELRGAIPFGLAMGLDPSFVFLSSIVANMVPIPFLLVLLEKLDPYLKKIGLYNKSVDRARNLSHKYVDKFGALGLVIFVGIPLPFTGAWTGCLAAFIFGMKRRVAFACIILGVLIAGVIVILATLGVISILRLFI